MVTVGSGTGSVSVFSGEVESHPVNETKISAIASRGEMWPTVQGISGFKQFRVARQVLCDPGSSEAVAMRRSYFKQYKMCRCGLSFVESGCQKLRVSSCKGRLD